MRSEICLVGSRGSGKATIQSLMLGTPIASIRQLGLSYLSDNKQEESKEIDNDIVLHTFGFE